MNPTIRKIVVPTDFTARADQAVDYAAALATTLEASVHLLHVIEEPFVAGGEWDLYVRDAQEVRERLYADVRSRLSATAARLEKQRQPITTEIRHGLASDGIINAATALGADLIVMSTHGRSGLPHLLLGSVTERVIRGAHCPVLAVREPLRDRKAAIEGTTTAA
jgi:nucleotide-binding universal stress UspA family protein